MKYGFYSLFFIGSLFCSEEPVRTPLTYQNEVTVTVLHPEGPIEVNVLLEIKMYARQNLIDVSLKIFHRERLVARRFLEIYW